MKIRMIWNHAVVEEVESNAMTAHFGHHHLDDAFSRKGMRDGEWEVFLKCDWEVVPEPVWLDVTRECEWSPACGFVHVAKLGLTGVCHVICASTLGYRIRQVPVAFTGKGIQNGCQPGHAFIVEKQIP